MFHEKWTKLFVIICISASDILKIIGLLLKPVLFLGKSTSSFIKAEKDFVCHYLTEEQFVSFPKLVLTFVELKPHHCLKFQIVT